MEEFIASPTAVLLAWINEETEKTKDWGEREYFDAGRIAVCMEVLSSLRTLRSFDSEEYGYALAVGALEGVLQRQGAETRAYETYDALSRWRRERARSHAYAAAGVEDDGYGRASASVHEALDDGGSPDVDSPTLPVLPRMIPPSDV